VRTPAPAKLAGLLRSRGLQPQPRRFTDVRLRVAGSSTDDVGRLAAQHGVIVLELTAVQASLEQAYLELTAGAAEYTGTGGPLRTGSGASTEVAA
jgi:ABC-2 type transport system ATP-binding protein